MFLFLKNEEKIRYHVLLMHREMPFLTSPRLCCYFFLLSDNSRSINEKFEKNAHPPLCSFFFLLYQLLRPTAFSCYCCGSCYKTTQIVTLLVPLLCEDINCVGRRETRPS